MAASSSSDLSRHRRTPELVQHLLALHDTVFPSVVALETVFIGNENQDLQRRMIHATGVFVAPNTILTSAQVVGRVFAYDPDAGQHKCYIAHTAVISRDRRRLWTKVFAISFSHDVAVLELLPPLEGEEEISFPHVPIAKSPPEKGHVLLGVVHKLNLEFAKIGGHVRAVGEKTFKSKAPWPLDNESEWLEFDGAQFNKGVPHDPCSDLFKSKEEIVGVSSVIAGSPLFNIDGELVGLGSWDVCGKDPSRPVSFGASLSRIMEAVEWAKNWKRGDIVVMDRWIQGCRRKEFIPHLDIFRMFDPSAFD